MLAGTNLDRDNYSNGDTNKNNNKDIHIEDKSERSDTERRVLENTQPRARWNRWRKKEDVIGAQGRAIDKEHSPGTDNSWTTVTKRKRRDKQTKNVDSKDVSKILAEADKKINSVEKDVNLLTKHIAEGINNLAKNEWQKFPEKLIIDSGAAETVMPSHWIENYKMNESAGSKEGVFYLTASGEPIYNEGEKTLMLMNEYGQARKMTFQCAKTTKALGSVSKICANGNRVVFDDEGSYIENKVTGEKLWLEQSEGVYHLNMQVAPVGYNETPFVRPVP